MDAPGVRCYQIDDQLIYSLGGNEFEGATISIATKLDPMHYPSFVNVAKSLTSTGEWKWVQTFGAYLLRAKDIDTRQTLERYASDRFIDVEISLNKDSGITRAEMVVYAKRILGQ